MRITLSDGDMNDIRNDGVVEITHPSGFSIYVEVNYDDCQFEYGEYSQPGKGRKSFCINSDDVLRITPRRTHDPSYYHNYPLCPSCGTYMIYNFEHCPKCGQKLDWSEKVGPS